MEPEVGEVEDEADSEVVDEDAEEEEDDVLDCVSEDDEPVVVDCDDEPRPLAGEEEFATADEELSDDGSLDVRAGPDGEGSPRGACAPSEHPANPAANSRATAAMPCRVMA